MAANITKLSKREKSTSKKEYVSKTVIISYSLISEMTPITFAVFCFFRSKLVRPVLSWSELQDYAHTQIHQAETRTKSAVTRSHCMSKEGSELVFTAIVRGSQSTLPLGSCQPLSLGFNPRSLRARWGQVIITIQWLYSWLLNNVEFSAPVENLLVTLHLALCSQGFTSVDSTSCRLVHVYWKNPGAYGPVLFKPVSFKG